MERSYEALSALLSSSPTVLALIVGFAAICVAGLAVYAMHDMTKRRDK